MKQAFVLSQIIYVHQLSVVQLLTFSEKKTKKNLDFCADSRNILPLSQINSLQKGKSLHLPWDYKLYDLERFLFVLSVLINVKHYGHQRKNNFLSGYNY